MDKDSKQPSLEELFKDLDAVVENLEKEEISLEDSFELYKRGMGLLKQCNETIDMVEKKVRILDENGENHDF